MLLIFNLIPSTEPLSFKMQLASRITLNEVGFQVLMIGRRKHGITPEQYRDHYENVHIPLMRKLMGDTFPLAHVRHYVHRDDLPKFPAAVFIGGQSDFEFDALAVLTYRDKAHFDANWAFFEDEESRAMIENDEKKFSEWVKGVVLETTVITDTKS